MKFKRLIPLVFAVSLTYAVVRYNVFKSVPLDHLPMYVVNKVVAMTALFLIGLSNVSQDNATRRGAGLMGFAVAGLHVLISQALLSPDYYPKLFALSDGLKGYVLTGELSILSGCLGFFLLFVLAWPKSSQTATSWFKALPWIVRGVLLLTALHCMFYGASGWFSPAKWPGYHLPPITLLSFLFALGALIWGALRSHASPQND